MNAVLQTGCYTLATETPPQYKLITFPHKIKLHISIKSTSNACGVEILDVWSVEQMLWQVALFKGGMR